MPAPQLTQPNQTKTSYKQRRGSRLDYIGFPGLCPSFIGMYYTHDSYLGYPENWSALHLTHNMR